jgi:hypothetical protein
MANCTTKLNLPKLRRAAVAVALFATIGGWSLPSVASTAAGLAEREYADAVQSFRTGRTSVAFGQFLALAQRGDVDSARIALFLYSYGPVLYGKQWDVLPADVDYWNTLVRNSGTTARPMPEFAPTVLQPSKARPAAGVRSAGIKTVKAN